MSRPVLPDAGYSPQDGRHHRIDWHLAVPVLGPALLMVAGNADFMFDQPGWVDTFSLLGRFWHYTEQNPLFEEYKNSRLPWILPGFLAHWLFDTVTASYVLHAATLLSSSIAVYLLLRDTLNERAAAAVTAAAWSCYTWIHGDGGWDYPLLAACAYYLFSMWMFARSALLSSRARIWAAAGGASLACAVHTHLVFAGFIPIAALLYGINLRDDVRAGRRQILSAAGYALLGGVAVTGLLAATNAATGGPWLFFLPQIEYALFLSADNRWLNKPSAWIPYARHLVIPCLILGASAIWLVAGRRRRPRDDSSPARFAEILVYQGLAAAGLMAFLQFIAGQTVIEPSYFAYPLYLHAFLALGALLWRSGCRHERFPVFAGASAMAIVTPLLLLFPGRLPGYADVSRFLLLPAAMALLVPVTVGVVGIALMCWLQGWRRLGAFAVFFGLLNAWVSFSQTAYGIGTPGVNRDAVIVIRSLDRYMSRLDPSLFAVRFWREPETVRGPYGPMDLIPLYESFLSTRRRSLVTAAYDRRQIRMDELTRDDLYTERCLGVLSSKASQDEVVARVKRQFRKLGLSLVEVGRHDTTSGLLSIAVTVLAMPHDATTLGYEDVPCPPRR